MRVAVAQMELRVYWPARLRVLHDYLAGKGVELRVMETAGKGSRYGVADGDRERPEWWQCLFPDERPEDVSSSWAYRAFLEAIDAFDPHVTLSGAIAFPCGAAAVRWSRKSRRAVAIMDDVRVSDVPRGRLTNWVKRRIYANVDALLIPAPSYVRDYEFWGVPAEKMRFGVNAVDNDFFAARSDECRERSRTLRTELGLPAPFFLGVGRQIAQKNWAALVEAYRKYRTGQPSRAWDLLLVGDGEERPALERQVAAAGVPGVHFHPFVDQTTLCGYYALAGCLVLPSHAETWGLVVNEALACGLPVLVSRQCGCAETLVKPGTNGWIFDSRDADGLAALMGRIASLSDKERAAMSGASRAMVSDWGLERFAQGAWEAVQMCRNVTRGFASPIDRAVLRLWKGRYRP